MSYKRRWIMVGSLAMALALGHQAALENQASADRPGSPVSDTKQNREAFLKTVGAADEEEVRDALLEGKTLADIAEHNGSDPAKVVALQIDELKAQVKERFLNGSIDKAAFEAQLSEIPELIRRSVYGST